MIRTPYQTLGLIFGRQWHDLIFLLWAFQLFAAVSVFCHQNKGLKEPTRSQFPTAKFKIFADDWIIRKSTLLGEGRGNCRLVQQQIYRGTEGKILLDG